MKKPSLVFFGTTHDSLHVVEALFSNGYSVAAIVTQPARPVGRWAVVTPSPVAVWGETHGIPVHSFPSNTSQPWIYKNEKSVISTLQNIDADLYISASYGQKIPWESITGTRLRGLNVHPSLLPRFKGADPVPWTILSGDTQTGPTIVTLSETFDSGRIVGRKTMPVYDTDTRKPLRERIFLEGSKLLLQVIPQYVKHPHTLTIGSNTTPSYARRLTRSDGYIPWDILSASAEGSDVPKTKRTELLKLTDDHISICIERMYRAFTPWPGIWTIVQIRGTDMRMKILHVERDTHRLKIITVQIEGKTPISFDQFKTVSVKK